MTLPKLRPLLLCAALLAGSAAWAQEALIRKNLSERLPNLPKIDEVSKTPIHGIYELRIGADVFYTDSNQRAEIVRLVGALLYEWVAGETS